MLDSGRLDEAGTQRLKFDHPDVTALGEPRATVEMAGLKTLFINTGSLCNIECVGCYMESSPKNDALVYISAEEVRAYLDEIATEDLPVEEIGFTGGEPFLNKDMPRMMEDALARGFRVLVLTNAMKPLWNKREEIKRLHETYGPALTLRISIDHYTQKNHEDIRGENTWEPMIKGLTWLAETGVNTTIAGRTLWHEDEAQARQGYAALLSKIGLSLDVTNPSELVLFPEMDVAKDVPEITTACWDILGVAPSSIMCASSRMVVKRKGADQPVVMPCTLLPYEESFEMGTTLQDAHAPVKLNHPHCSTFCVLGGATCSPDR